MSATRVTISPAAVRPCCVSPSGWPNQVPSGTTMSPWVMTFNVAGSTTMPVKIGMKSHTRLTKNDNESSRRGRERQRRRVHAEEHGDVAHERGHDEQAEERNQLDPRFQALEQTCVATRRRRRTWPGAGGPRFR